MREILFRGKRTDTGEWVEGYFEKYNGCAYMNLQTERLNSGGYPIREFVEVIPETLGQYTGLSDKNGKRIFESDICRNTRTGEIVSVKWHGTMAGYVWSKRKENCKSLFDFGALFRAYDKYEVIGNIHDNPKLLKSEDQTQ